MEAFVGFITANAKIIYVVVSAFLVVFLYGYIYHLYSSQKSGKVDYEKYARLALDDNLNDAPIEPRDIKAKK